MMIGVLIGLSVFFSFCSWIYLTKEDLFRKEEKMKFGEIVRKNIKESVFLCISVCFLSGLSVVLCLIYKTNTLLANAKLIVLLCILMTAAVTDFKDHIIPNFLILFGLGARFVFAVAEVLSLGVREYWTILKSDLISLAVVAVIFVLGVLIIKNGVSMGDIKLLMLMGLFQGFRGIFGSLFFSLLISFFVGIVLLTSKKKKRKDMIAFAPALYVGTFISIVISGM